MRLEVTDLKIAHVTSFFQPKYYKSNEYFISKEMANLGHEVVLFCPDKDPAWQNSGNNSEIHSKIEEFDGFKVQRIPAAPVLLNMSIMPSLFGILKEQDFDLIHSHEYFTSCSFQSAMASSFRNVPFVITQHNDQLPNRFLHRFGYLFSSVTLGKYSSWKARKIIALSNDIKFHLLNMGCNENKIELIPNAVDTSIFSPGQKNILQSKWGISGNVILFVGRLVAEKGADILIQSFHKVSKKIPSAKLVIVGKGPKESDLKILKKKLSVKNIFFIERVESKLMPNIYAGCSILVVPSFREPFGNVVLEAMSCGKPVIGSYVGGIKDTIVDGETGYHFSVGNVKMLSDLLLKILINERLKKELGDSARKRVLDNYDTKTIANKIEKLYLNSLKYDSDL